MQVSAVSQTPLEARHSKLPGRNAFAGHADPPPEQNSATSHPPVLARHSIVPARNPSPGHALLEPVHVSARSQGPAEGRHSKLAGRKPVGSHRGVSPSQTMLPVAQLSAGSQAAPGWQLPQVGPLQNPVEHTVPTSTLSSGGQVGALPSHTSSASHSPAAARHTTPAAAGPADTHTGEPDEQSVTPSSQASPRAQASPSAQFPASFPASKPASVPPSVPASVPTSTAASCPASDVPPSSTQPLPGTHAWEAPHSPCVGVKRHSPAVHATSPQVSTSVGQSIVVVHALS